MYGKKIMNACMYFYVFVYTNYGCMKLQLQLLDTPLQIAEFNI